MDGQRFKLLGLILIHLLPIVVFVSGYERETSNENSSSHFVMPNGSMSKITSLDEFLSNQQPKSTVNVSTGTHGDSKTLTTTKGSHEEIAIKYHWEVKGLLNVSYDYPLAYSKLICGYIWPLMALITLFSNVMIVFILTQRDMRTPTNVVLTSIAIADIIPIVIPVPWFVYLFAMGNEKTVLYPPIVCYVYQHSTRSVSEIFYFISTWLNVLLAIQDYLTACWPNLAQKYCKIRAVVWQIVVLTLLAFLINLPQAFKIVFKPVLFNYNEELTWGCKRRQAKWFKDLVGEYAALYDDIFTAIIVVFVDGGPALALIILTALLICQLKRQRIQGHFLMEQARTASKRRREQRRQQEVEASARVMIFVLLAFLAVKIPFATTYTLMIIQSRFEVHFVENLVDFQKWITITDIVFVLSYPINFTIFCCCSKRFRHKCTTLLAQWATAYKARERSHIGILWAEQKRRLRPKLSFESTFDESIMGENSLLEKLEVLREEDPEKVSEQEVRRMSNISMDKVQPSPMPALSTETDEMRLERPIQVIDFRALIESGTLCYECIMHYEQFKKHYREQLSRRVETPAIIVEDVNEPSSGVELIDNCSVLEAGSSVAWPPPPPPPPPQAIAAAPPMSFDTEWIRKSSNTSSPESGTKSDKIGPEKETMILRMGQRFDHGLTPQFGGSGCSNDLKRNSDWRSVSMRIKSNFRASNVNLRDRHSSGPPGNQWGESRPAKCHLETIENSLNRRSISLSDSKLSTLPNATGFLANVMVTTFMGSKGKELSGD